VRLGTGPVLIGKTFSESHSYVTLAGLSTFCFFFFVGFLP